MAAAGSEVEDYSKTISMFKDSPIVAGFFNNSCGYAVFPIVGKAFSEIVLFQDERAYEQFTSGSFEFDANAQAVTITAGAQAQTGTAEVGAGADAGTRTAHWARLNQRLVYRDHSHS